MTWSQTRSGNAIDLLEPTPDQINLGDMCHALSNINRFCGHANRPYSVAEHSLLVARMVKPKYRLEALCHDLSEAYLGDVPGQIKHACPGYKRIESEMVYTIRKALGLNGHTLPAEVHLADKQALLVELEAMLPPLPRPFTPVLKHWDHYTLVLEKGVGHLQHSPAFWADSLLQAIEGGLA